MRLAAKLTGWKIDIVSGGEMIAEADEEGKLTAQGAVTDETLDEEVTEVLEALNVTEDIALKNSEVENVVEEVSGEVIEEITSDPVENSVEETTRVEETK